MTLKHRSDIDELRSVEVIPVLWHHIGVPYSGGEFAGADIYFVKSGYLITSIIAYAFKAGRYTFAKFCERRIQRIFPPRQGGVPTSGAPQIRSTRSPTTISGTPE